MNRIIAVDYGLKRCGLAWTDLSGIIASPLPPCLQTELLSKLEQYIATEPIQEIVVGFPLRMDNRPTHLTASVEELLQVLSSKFTNIKISQYDERFTSKIAFQALIDGGASKKKRSDKALLDSISATVLLQNYLEYKNNR